MCAIKEFDFYGEREWKWEIDVEENLVWVSEIQPSTPGLPPLPPGTKYSFKKSEPKFYTEENSVRLYIYSVSCPRGCRPFPQLQNMGLKNWNQKFALKNI